MITLSQLFTICSPCLDIDTRRRAACDLVRGLCKFFEGPVTAIFSGYVNSMLTEYAKNPGENWKHKDAAIYLVTSLASKAQTQKVVLTFNFQSTIEYITADVTINILKLIVFRIIFSVLNLLSFFPPAWNNTSKWVGESKWILREPHSLRLKIPQWYEYSLCCRVTDLTALSLNVCMISWHKHWQFNVFYLYIHIN